MKIFITGATGFIGQHLVRHLINVGHTVTVNLNVNDKSFENTVDTYRLCQKTISEDIQFLADQQFDGIIHLASLYLTVHKPEEAVKLIDSNVRFSTYILECAAQAGISWFINTGTFWQNYQNAVYSPVNLYAATKQAFESIARYYIETEQIRFVTLRLSDTYGPNDTRPKIFTLWERIARSGETLDMSAGEQVIDISHVDDIVSAFTLLATHLQNNQNQVCNGDVFAVKAKQRYTLKQLASVYENATGSKLNINWGARPYRDREVMTPWENGMVVPEWTPKMDIVEGIKSLN